MAASDEAESSGELLPKCTLKDTSGTLFYCYAFNPNLTLSPENDSLPEKGGSLMLNAE